jgi:hypothetical protein
MLAITSRAHNKKAIIYAGKNAHFVAAWQQARDDNGGNRRLA